MSEQSASVRVTPARKGTPPLTTAAIAERLQALQQWSVVEIDGISQLQRTFALHNFAAALVFANKVGALAEAADHHPAITVEWGKVTVRWWTHVIGGLHDNDFLMAARCNQITM
ncbi:MAG TPA: 4a-hydroxytetrahydrobiopterin dehydratase [Candidatus Acidoferrum sp.]|nr:4a-hydroxytetrahydrobiopterin dehydratase [Candidatus Acidoferrum sp.]